MTTNDFCSHACVFYFPEGEHDPGCTPIEPPSVAQRQADRNEYKKAMKKHYKRQKETKKERKES